MFGALARSVGVEVREEFHERKIPVDDPPSKFPTDKPHPYAEMG